VLHLASAVNRQGYYAAEMRELRWRAYSSRVPFCHGPIDTCYRRSAFGCRRPYIASPLGTARMIVLGGCPFYSWVDAIEWQSIRAGLGPASPTAV